MRYFACFCDFMYLVQVAERFVACRAAVPPFSPPLHLGREDPAALQVRSNPGGEVNKVKLADSVKDMQRSPQKRDEKVWLQMPLEVRHMRSCSEGACWVLRN